jgi:ribosomal protein S18 acetylase RimI-like enzyme
MTGTDTDKGAHDLRSTKTVRLSFGKAGYVLIDRDHNFPGSTSLGLQPFEGSYLSYIYVRPEYRRRGIGERMLRFLGKEYPKLWGIAGSDNGAALMSKCGVFSV